MVFPQNTRKYVGDLNVWKLKADNMVVEKIHLIKVIFIIGESRISRRGYGANPKGGVPTYCFGYYFPKTAWNWG